MDTTRRAEPKQAEFQKEQIASIEEVGAAETFDLTVADNHSFIANGIVVHNTLPKHTRHAKVLRRAYISPEDYCIVSWDYSQGELRITACLANEENMIAAYLNGIDLHLKTGAELNGMSLEDALVLMDSDDPEVLSKITELRFGGKAGNFGLIYGMQAEGFMHYARDTYGVKLTLQEAQQQYHTFLHVAYPRLPDWHKEYQAFAHKHEMVRSPLGRIRHLPLINSSDWKVKSLAERQAINSPVQSTLSDMVQLALAEFKAKHGCPDTARLFKMTHDELSAYVHVDHVDFWVPEVKHLMENLPLTEYFGWKPQLVFEADAEIGFNLAEMRTVKENMVPSVMLANMKNK